MTGLLDLDPLVVSRWMCGEDLRGVYQPIVLHDCVLDGVDLEGRTFYEMVEFISCRVTQAHFSQAYFYSTLMVEDCVFEGRFDGRAIQNDGRIVVHSTIFHGWADFGELNLRSQVDLVGVTFAGGTNLLQVLISLDGDRLGRDVRLRECRFRAEDVPKTLDPAAYGIELL